MGTRSGTLRERIASSSKLVENKDQGEHLRATARLLSRVQGLSSGLNNRLARSKPSLNRSANVRNLTKLLSKNPFQSGMADAALRTRALSLYRSLIRSCRTWPGPPKEKQYIYEEASVLFRKDQHLTDPDEIAKKIDEGEKRYQIAWHYKIPYPRIPNYPLGAFQEKPETVYQIPSQEMGSLDDDLDDLPGLGKSRRSFQAL